mgnify:CR=1 FL=1
MSKDNNLPENSTPSAQSLQHNRDVQEIYSIKKSVDEDVVDKFSTN